MRLLRQGPFARICAGAALNAIGTWATLIALWGYATAHFHQGPHGVVLIGLTWGLPMAVLSPLAGVPIDRIGPRRVLLASNACGAAASVGLALAGSFDVLLVLAAVAGTVESVGRPASSALPARLVDPADLLAANAVMGAAEQSSIIFGPQTAFGVGLVGASLVVPRLGDRVVSVRAVAITVVAAGVMAGTYVGTPWLGIAFAGVGGWGIVVGCFMAPLQTLLQRAAPPEAEGRILALSSTANGIGNTASVPVAGLVVGVIGVQATGIAVGACLVAAGLVGVWVAGPSAPIVSDSVDLPDLVGAEST